MAKASMEDVARWQRRHEDYQRSGLSRKAFCERFKLKLSTLDTFFLFPYGWEQAFASCSC